MENLTNSFYFIVRELTQVIQRWLFLNFIENRYDARRLLLGITTEMNTIGLTLGDPGNQCQLAKMTTRANLNLHVLRIVTSINKANKEN